MYTPLGVPTGTGGSPAAPGVSPPSLPPEATYEALQAMERGEIDALYLVSDGKAALFSRQGSQDTYRLLIEQMQEGAVTLDAEGTVLYANRSMASLAGVALDRLMGVPWVSLLAPEDRARALELLHSLSTGQHSSGEFQLMWPNGSRHPIRLTATVLDGVENLTIAAVVVDLSLFKQAEEQLRIAARVFDKTGEAIAITDPMAVVQSVNDAFTKTTGFDSADIVGKPIKLLNSGHHSADFFDDMRQHLQTSGYWQGEIWNRRKDGVVEPQWMGITAVTGDTGELEHYVCVLSDLGKMRDSQRKIEFLATHDTLTKLPNRSLFVDRLHQGIARIRRSGGQLAVLFLDLDDFKKVNDTLGHDVGDRLLEAVATRLRALLRDVDTLARQGGDEFTLILNDCNAERADMIARRLVAEVGQAYTTGGHEFFVTASVGVALFPGDGGDASELLRHADAAMYRAKEQGRNRVEFYRPEFNARLLKRAEVESALRKAVHGQGLRLVYQPKIGLSPGHPMIGAEALLRWNEPSLGSVSPGEFIPVAESSGLIAELDRLVVSMLLRDALAWKAAGLNVPKLALNVSARTLRDGDYSAHLGNCLTELRGACAGVQLEITESTLLDGTSQVMRVLNDLHDKGITIAIDDFGTGYSSLSYLKRLPLNELKIDKSFVDGLGQDRDDEAIAAAVLALARALGLKTVAEGVETQRQLDWLLSHGCDVAQGFLFSRPLEWDDFAGWLRGPRQAP